MMTRSMKSTWRIGKGGLGTLLIVSGLLVSGLSVGVALGSSTNDREYWMGDDAPGVPPQDGEGAVAGQPVGVLPEVTTWDWKGNGPLEWHNLTPNDLTATGPTYVDVGVIPGRAGNLAIQLDGTDDYLYGYNLNQPQRTISAVGSNDFGTAGPLIYDGMSNRGFKLWVQPDGTQTGVRQNIVIDSNQHGLIITPSNTWGMVYSGNSITDITDSGVAVAFDSWTHAMVVRPAGNAGGSRLYLDGVAVAGVTGGYANGDLTPLVIGSNTGGTMENAESFTGGTQDFFKGIVDDLEMFVFGDTTAAGGQAWGEFSYLDDIATPLGLYNGKVGDFNQDGSLTQLDINAIVTGWSSDNLLPGGMSLGDMTTYAQGDIDLNGVVDIFDWVATRRAFIDDGQVAPALAFVAVPEPASLVLLGLGGLLLLSRRRKSVCHAVAGSLKRTTGMVALLIVGLTLSTASAETIGINWTSFDGNALTAAQRAGVVGEDNWNNAVSVTMTGSIADLTDGDGSATGASATWTAGFIGTNAQDPTLGGDFAMNSGWYGINNNPATRNDLGTIQINNVPTSLTTAGYDMYVYIGSAALNRTMKLILNNQATGPAIHILENDTVFDGTYTEGSGVDYASATMGNYVVFRGLTDTNLTVFGETETNSRAAIRGIQITNEAPRPSTPILSIDRDTGAMSLTNDTTADLDITAYTISSASDTLQGDHWTPIADSNSDWTVLARQADELSEGTFQETTFTSGSSLSLGTDVWTQYIEEDVQMLLSLADDQILSIPVQFTGNGGEPFKPGDLNFDGFVDSDDWLEVFHPDFGMDTSALTTPERYALGDMNVDGLIDKLDFSAFKDAFNLANNNPGAFRAMLASVPEPSSMALLVLGGLLTLRRRRRQPDKTVHGDRYMKAVHTSVCSLALLVAVLLLGLVSTTSAQTTLFDLSEGNPDMNWEGLTTGALMVDGITLSLDAVGDAGAVFDTNATGTGVNSDGDDALGGIAQRRVDGTLPTPESIEFSFDADVVISSILVGSLSTNGSETMLLQFISGDNPFTTMSGYTGDYVLGADNLAYAPTSGGNPHLTTFGTSGQSEFTVRAGTVLSFTSNPAVGGGILFDNIEVSEVIVPMALQVNTATGAGSIVNDSGVDYDMDYYEITSEIGSLTPGTWDSLENQDFENNGGPTGNGDGWEELEDIDTWLAEGYLQGSSVISNGQSIGLGAIFSNGGSEDPSVTFTYRTASGSFVSGVVEFIEGGLAGDFNGDGFVDQSDLDLALLNWGSESTPPGWTNDPPTLPVGSDDLDRVRVNWGSGTPAAAAASAVPEPAAMVLLGVGSVFALLRRRKRQ